MLDTSSSCGQPALATKPWVGKPVSLRKPLRNGSFRGLPRVCLAQSRPFQQGQERSEPRAELVSHALAAAAEAEALTVQHSSMLQEPLSAGQQLQQLRLLCQALRCATTYEAKVDLLLANTVVRAFFNTREGRQILSLLGSLTPKEVYVLACLPAMGQEHVLTLLPQGGGVGEPLVQLAGALCRVEDFYDAIGGLPGYQRQCLQLICEAAAATQQQASAPVEHQGGSAGAAAAARTDFLVPPGINLSDPGQAAHAAQATLAGLEAVPSMAEVYPLGGAGDRLGLCCESSGDSLPTAVLQYCGRTLLEALVRDLQAREYLYWRVHGTQHTTPVAIMTSAAKGNHWRVKQAFEAAGWFGRGRNAFKLFQQPLVPMVSGEDGRWLLSAPLQPLMKPGGHGVIWKLMLDTGVFGWLRGQGRQAAIVRQISNPMAGVDNTLLALAGSGFSSSHAFGFASCERAVGAAEGINVLMQQEVAQHTGCGGGYEYRVTNVEYTEFERLGFADQAAEGSTLSKFPANTNVLYVGLQAAESLVRDSVARGSTDAILPGMILNLKKQVTYHDAWLGRERCVAAGRLECTMQNLADCLVTRSQQPLQGAEAAQALDCFVLYNQRRKVTSSAKRKLRPGSTKVHQTPDGSFYDLQHNARELLLRCGFDVPEVGSVSDYLSGGPGFIFLFHPALGPLWEVVAQKLCGGSLGPHCELVLEVAEAHLTQLHVQGSLLVHAECVMGHMDQPASPHSHIAPAAGATTMGSRQATTHSPNSLRSKGVGLVGGGQYGKVHNGVEHGATESGAFGAAAVPAAAAHHLRMAPDASGHAMSAVPAEPRLVYSERCGRVRLNNVRVQNRGVDWDHPDNVYWRHKVRRHESARIVLHGRSEFEARDVTLAGDLMFEVPDGHRMTVRAGPGGEPVVQLQPLGPRPTWRWDYSLATHSHSGPSGSAPSILLHLAEDRPAGPPAATTAGTGMVMAG